MVINEQISNIIYNICNPKELVNKVVISNYNSLKEFDIGLIIPTHNRPEYLKYVLHTLKMSNISSKRLVILIFDDNSNENTCELINRFNIDNVPIIRIFTNNVHGLVPNNSGGTVLPGSIFPFTIRYGMEILFSLGAKYVMNNDSDSIFSKNWFDKTINALNIIQEPYYVLAGFKCQQKYHSIKVDSDIMPILHSFGGVNFTINKEMFFNHVKGLIYDYTFDWTIVDHCKYNNIPIYLIKPSIVQHIGMKSVIIRGGVINTDTHTNINVEINDTDIDELDTIVRANSDFPFADDFIYRN